MKNLYPILGKLAPKTHPFARHILSPNIGEYPPWAFNPCLMTNAIIEENRLTAFSWYYSCCLKRLWNPEINKRYCRPLNHCTNRGKEKEIYKNIVKRKILSTKGSKGWTKGSKMDVFRGEIYPQINVTWCAVLGVPTIIYQKYSIPTNNLLGRLSTITYNLIW